MLILMIELVLVQARLAKTRPLDQALAQAPEVKHRRARVPLALGLVAGALKPSMCQSMLI
jgi:hypothetical protein